MFLYNCFLELENDIFRTFTVTVGVDDCYYGSFQSANPINNTTGVTINNFIPKFAKVSFKAGNCLYFSDGNDESFREITLNFVKDITLVASSN